MGSIKDRPVMTCEEFCSGRSPGSAVLNAEEFVKLVAVISGQKATRRILQFYSSPKARLLPLPVYRNRHTAHYLHPEHTLRFAMLLHLRAAYFLPLKLVKAVLDGLPTEHYDLILSDVLSAADIVRLARDGGAKAWVREALVGRASRALEAARILGKTVKEAGAPISAAHSMGEHRSFNRRVPKLVAVGVPQSV